MGLFALNFFIDPPINFTSGARCATLEIIEFMPPVPRLRGLLRCAR